MAAGAAVLALSACLSPGELENKGQFIAIIGPDGGLGAGPGEGGVVGGSGGAASGNGGNGGKGGSAGAMSGSGGAAPNPCDGVVTKLMESCTASVCHGTESSNALKLEGGDLPARLIGAKATTTCMELPYIDPAAPEKSLILTKMTSKPPCGSPMPLGAPMLPTAAERACVLEWINEGIDGPAMPGMDAGMMPAGDAGCTRGDTDKDGTNDCDDKCINDAEKTMPGMCGCGMPEDDSDDDGALDCEDDCPNDPAIMMGECMMPAGMPGLRVGELDGPINTADDNPGTMVAPLGPVLTEETDNPVMTTIVYTGQIRIGPSGVASFYENYDDSVRLFVDGMMLLSNGTWNEPTAAVIMRPEGWYDFELRLGNDLTLSGPPPDVGIAFGYSPMNRNGSTTAADYVLPRNSNATTGNLFITDEP